MTTRIVQAESRPHDIRILSDKVLTATDIHETDIGYRYEQTEYTKDEYIALLNEQITDTQLALVELYEGVIENG